MVQCEKNRDIMTIKSIGETVQNVLKLAKQTERITLGFSDAIKVLSKTPEEAQFCFLTEPKHGDSATHMNEVLLQAFCYEHGIYIIKVDDGRKLAHILGTLNADETCVLILKHKVAVDIDNVSLKDVMGGNDDAQCTKDENQLISFCETSSWQNVVKLPES